jgi:Spy/CpxP family protein refolding chaperone
MNLRSIQFKHILAVAGATLMISLFAHADSGAGAPPAHCSGPMMGPEGHSHEGMGDHGHGPGPMGMPPMMPPMGDPFMEGMPPPPFLHDLNLTEAQQDKIFSILHNNAPLLREQSKLVKKSGDAIHEMADSANYDEAKLKALAESHARALAEIEVIHARSMHQIQALLTPEQHKQIDAMKAKFDEHRTMRDQIRDIGAKPETSGNAIAE